MDKPCPARSAFFCESLPEGNACSQLWHNSWCQTMVIYEELIAPSHPRIAEKAAYSILSWTGSNNRLIRNCMTIDIPMQNGNQSKSCFTTTQSAYSSNNFFPSWQLLACFLSVDIHVLSHIQQSSIPLCALQTGQPNSPSNLLKFNLLLRDQYAVTHMTIALHVISFSSESSGISYMS